MTSLDLYQFEMDFSNLDDKMELGISPYPHADDIDFEFEPAREQSIDRSMVDEEEVTGNNTDPMQADTDDVYNYDDMIEDEITQEAVIDNSNDLAMEPDENQDQDEEILYDEDEEENEPDLVNMTNDNNEQGQTEQNALGAQEEPQETEIPDPPVESGEVMDNSKKDAPHTNPTTENSESVNNVDEVDTDQLQESKLETAVDEGVTVQTQVLDFATQDAAFQHEEDPTNYIANTDGTNSNLQSAVVQDSEEQQEVSQFAVEPSEEVTQATSDPNHGESDNVRETKFSEGAETLHPVTIVYLGQEMSLFPPTIDDASATFFLSESSLAYESFDKLLAACREILGESLEHDDELVIDITALGLHICEDSKYSSQLSLSQVLEVYLSLTKNEKMENIDPLYCTLSSRVCLATQYAYLAESAQEGKTYTQIAAENLDPSEQDVHSVYDETTQYESNEAVEAATDAPPHSHDEEKKKKKKKKEEGESEHEETETIEDEDTGLALTSHTADDDTEGVSRENQVPQEISEGHQNTSINEERDGLVDDDFEPEGSSMEHRADEEEISNIETRDDPVQQEAQHDDINYDAEQVQGEGNGEYVHPEESEVETASVSSHTIGNDSSPRADALNRSDADNSVKSQDQNVEKDRQHYQAETDLYDMEENLFDDADIEQNGEEKGHTAQDDAAMTELSTDLNNNGAAAHQTVEGNGRSLDDSVALDGTHVEESEHHEDQPEDEIETFLPQAKEVAINGLATPSKQGKGKRKVSEDDEDLDFLDLSTPEPKRNRSS